MAENIEINIIGKFRDLVSRPVEGLKAKFKSLFASIKKNILEVVAAIYSLKKAWDVAKMGAIAEQIEASFRAMAYSVGVNAERLRAELIRVSGATVNFSNVAAQVSALLAQGLNADQIIALMRQARAEAKLFGTTTEQAFKVIASAITGGLVTTLRRSYGLQLSLEEAVNDYAKATGKTADEVKKFYLAQAIANHILKQAKGHLKAVNLEVMSNYEKIQLLQAQWTSFLETVGQLLLRLFGGVTAFFMTLSTGFINVLRVLHKPLVLLAVAIEKLLSLMSRLPKVGRFFEGLRDSARRLREELELNQAALGIAAQRAGAKARYQWSLVVTSADNSMEAIKKRAKVMAEAIKTQVGEMAEGVKDSIKDIGNTSKGVFNEMVEYSKEASRRMQNILGDYLYNVLKGKVRGIKGLFRSLGDMILQMFSQKLAVGILGWTGIGGVFDKIIGGIFGHQLGTQYIPRTGLYLLHRGEKVIPPHEKGSEVGMTVVVNQYIQSWDVQDIWRNRKALAEMIGDEIRSNGKIRGVIKAYG